MAAHVPGASAILHFAFFPVHSDQAASVLPRVSGVLETLPRADAQPI
jgi:hypothetical protein